jgi:hypothetical protein
MGKPTALPLGFIVSEKVALKLAAQIYDWLADHEGEISNGAYNCEKLKLILWQQPKIS